MNRSSNFKLVGMAILALIWTVLAIPEALAQDENPQFQDDDIGRYVRAKTSQTIITPGITPVIIYRHDSSMASNTWLYCSVGMVYAHEKEGLVVATAEHTFNYAPETGPETFRIESLRGQLDQSNKFFARLVKSSADYPSPRDIAIVKLGSRPASFTLTSGFVGKPISLVPGEVMVLKKKVPLMRSVLSGEIVPTVGYMHSNYKLGDSWFVLIDYKVISGESGTPFVDGNGGVWFLHGKTDARAEQEFISIHQPVSGRKATAVASVSGPLGGRYDHGK